MDVAEANRWYFQLGEWRRQQWRDWPVYKYPTDLLTYHYLIRRVQAGSSHVFGFACLTITMRP